MPCGSIASPDMRKVFWDDGTLWDSPNIFWRDDGAVELLPGDEGYMAPSPGIPGYQVVSS